MNPLSYFDIRSFWLLGAVCYSGSGVLVLLVKQAYPQELNRVLSMWSSSWILMGITIALRLQYSVWGTVPCLALGSVLLSVSVAMQHVGIRWLKGLKPYRGISFLPPLLLLPAAVWFTAVHFNAVALYCAVLGICGLQQGMVAFALLRRENNSRPLPDTVAGFACMMMSIESELTCCLYFVSGSLSGQFSMHDPRAILNALVNITTEVIIFPMFLMMISERLKQRLADLAMRDTLTSLYNRRAFDELALHSISAAVRSGEPLSLAIFDLDYFKEVNDTLGHAAGDAILRQASQVLRESLRSEDILCRWGGDEFCALLPHASQEQAAQAIERVQNSFRKTRFEVHGHVIPLAISIGMASSVPGNVGLEDLIHRADAKLYQSKKGRRPLPSFSRQDSDLLEALVLR